MWRVGVDAGFSCPNRRDGRGPGGCAYCAADGARAPYLGTVTDTAEQVRAGLAFLRRRYRAEAFFLYFQSFSSTNAPAEELRSIYDEGLAKADPEAPFLGLVVSTRPDCVDGEKADLLASYAERGLEVWVELGLQSSHDRTLARIRRGHDFAAFIAAREELKIRGLRTAAHVILGLPGESRRDMLETVDRVAELGLEGVKFHDLHVPRSTALEREYLAGELTLLHPRALPSILADCLERLPASCEVMRLSSDAAAASRAAPRRPTDKARLYRDVEAELARRGTRQGDREGAWRAGNF